MARRRNSNTTVFFSWERRRARLAGLSRRHARQVLLAVGAGLLALVLIEAEGRRRAVYATRAEITNVVHAIEAYRADHDGHCPPGGAAELVAPADGREPYLARTPRDGWGNALRITCPGRKHPTGADVVSAGPSGTFEDADQIE